MQRDGIIRPLLGRSSSLCRSARFFWSKASKSTVPLSRTPTTAFSMEFSITMVSVGFNGSTSSCTRLKAGNREERIWNIDDRTAAKMFKTATDTLDLSRMTMYQTRHCGASVDRVRSFRTLQKVHEVSGELSAVSQDTTRAVVWRLTTTLSLSCSEVLARRAEEC